MAGTKSGRVRVRPREDGQHALVLAEEYARSRGVTSLGLNVFGFNHRARRLYESLGYAPTSIKMRKSLIPE